MRRQSSGHNLNRQGVVLFLVVAIVLMMTLLTYGFLISMRTQNLAAAQAGDRLQARQAAFSARELVCWLLEKPLSQRLALGGLDSNEQLFRRIDLNRADERDVEISNFGFVLADRTGSQYGIENLSAKIDLNRLLTHDETLPGFGRECLMRLPNMTEVIADHILDWVDSDNEPREFGAEADFYRENSGVLPPNLVPHSLAELLHIPGITPELIFGKTTDGSQTEQDKQPADTGWARFLTVRSGERNESFDGNPRIFLNQSDLAALHAELSETISVEVANFVILSRQYGLRSSLLNSPDPNSGESNSGESNSLQDSNQIQLDFTLPASYELDTNLEIMNAFVRIENESENTESVLVKSPFTLTSTNLDDQIEKFLDATTTSSAKSLPGRVNLLLAPREVLLSVPGMDEALVEQILATRDSQKNSVRTPFWLLSNGSINMEQMKQIAPHVTIGGEICHLVFGGRSDARSAPMVFEACLDATSGTATQVYSTRILDVRKFNQLTQNATQDR